MDYDKLLKIVIVGDSGVGKSQLANKYANNEFNINSKSTIGVDIYSKIVTIDNENIKLQLWDTAGQERYRCITEAYYRGTKGIIFCFSICDKKSFENLNIWITTAKKYIDDNTLVAIVGTKTDLEHLREISSNEAKKFANNIDYHEVSALTGKGISEMFDDFISKIVIKNKYIEIENKIKLHNDTLVLANNKRKNKCCH